MADFAAGNTVRPLPEKPPVWRRAWAWLEPALWAAMGLLLPVTSLPLVKKLSGADMVAPAAGPLVAVLLTVSVLPYLWRGGRIPRATLPLLAFISAVLVSCALAFFLPIPPFRDLAIQSSMLKALLTLAVGAGFFFAVTAWAMQPGRAAQLLRWIDWGGLAIIAWALAQALVYRLAHHYPRWIEQLQALITTGNLVAGRSTAFAFEPSWLAHQLNMLYLPFWFAAALRGTTVHRLRFGPLTFERLLLAGGLATLYLTLSRVGYLAFLLCIFLLGGMGTAWLVRKLRGRILAGSAGRRLLSGLVTLGLLLGLALGAALLLLGTAYVMSKVDSRMSTLFDISYLKSFSILAYANQLVFAERVVFWQTGWAIFNDFPIFGVGLGNSGYFFAEKLNTFAWGLTEVRTLMYQWTTIPNIKSLWVRLLAETGVVGTAFFAGWLYTLWASADHLLRKKGLAGTVGLAGLFVLVGLVAEGFSVDTFALPYFWVSFGLLAGLAASAAD